MEKGTIGMFGMKLSQWHSTLLYKYNSTLLESLKVISDYLVLVLYYTNILLPFYVGKAASINSLCVTPQEFKDRLGSFMEYCPVSLVERGELVDCKSQPSLQYAVEYQAKYYR